MSARLIFTCLIVSTFSSPLFAASLTRSIEREAGRLAAQSTETHPGGMKLQSSSLQKTSRSRTFWLGVILLGVGSSVALYNAGHVGGCGGISTPIPCEPGHSTGGIVTGVAIAGVGGYLIYKGRLNSSPQIW
jgi:hypothetical protein